MKRKPKAKKPRKLKSRQKQIQQEIQKIRRQRKRVNSEYELTIIGQSYFWNKLAADNQKHHIPY